ncbi:junctional sarcoplasmic reticulum protein 1 [Molossus molossus]|uniref:Junctional sarcoplasmic reticulum protein 1 n=1 Tax=Molossus molossus TaxID=27622 RepID=A0A7J8I7D4_MOLMO|nr:junctional sarcoplasmic reticulum protein 1 [Molossus molossus]KAF6480483.1 junctional sarcoplasmic reticulum protein 1 [Molossus molossus]
MTTMALEEPDGGLGSCQAVTPRVANSSSWPHDSQEPEAEGSPAGRVDVRPKKTEKEPVAKVAPGSSKERLKAGATPRSPARKKAQSAPPPQPPPPPPALSEELPWGDLSLNKCLVLASLVALLGSAFQLCRDVVVGEADTPAPVPERWVPPSSAPKKPVSPPLKPVAWTPSSGPLAPQVQVEERTDVPRSTQAAEKVEGDPKEAAGEKHGTLAHEGPKEKLQKERPRKDRPRKEERPRKERQRTEERPRKAEKPRPAREPRESLLRRWKAHEGGHRLWLRDSRDSEDRKRQAWASPRRPNAEDWPPGRQKQKQRAGKGRD